MFTDLFPVDMIQDNYVRNVRNCIFSIAYPTPFKSKIRLVAVSKVGYYFFSSSLISSNVLKYIQLNSVLDI